MLALMAQIGNSILREKSLKPRAGTFALVLVPGNAAFGLPFQRLTLAPH